jgi:ATP-binding cassette subfamily C (CFTR/MRP) protein 1
MSTYTKNCLNDQLLGPVIKGCRGNFDFTQLFENAFLSILPSSIFLVLSVVRIANLIQKSKIPGLQRYVIPKEVSGVYVATIG